MKITRKILSLVLCLCMLLCGAVYAETAISALDAFNALTGQQATINNPDKTNAEYLADIMNGVYAMEPIDFVIAGEMAAELKYLTGITTRDIAAFASANGYAMAQVRNAYYIALANALRAEIMVNPASEERYRNVQMILALFLETNEANVDHNSRQAIRAGMTSESAAAIAREYSLPVDFVAFVIMDDDWDDDDWSNDDDWRAETGWDNDDLYEDSLDDLKVGDKDTGSSTRIADLQAHLIALGYLTGKADGVFGPATQAALREYQMANGKPATGVYEDSDFDDMIDNDVVSRWDYDNSFDNTPDFNTNSPEYDSSPAATDSPDYDYSVDYDNSPVATDSPDYDNSSDYDSSSDYENS